jgi:hypothetical protein
MKMVVAFVQPHMTQKVVEALHTIEGLSREASPLTSVTLSMRHIAVLTAPGSPE